MSPLAKEYRTLVEKRKKIEYIVEWETEPTIQMMIRVLIRDIDETIKFLDTECTADEISWISEIFDELVEITQSRKLFNALQRTINKYPEEDKKHFLTRHLKMAEEFFDENM